MINKRKILKGKKRECDCKSETTVFTASAIKKEANERKKKLNKCNASNKSTGGRKKKPVHLPMTVASCVFFGI